MLRLRRGSTGQLRSGIIPLYPRYFAPGRQNLKRWPRSSSERLLGTKDHSLVSVRCDDLFHTGSIFPSLGEILRTHASHAVRTLGLDLTC